MKRPFARRYARDEPRGPALSSKRTTPSAREQRIVLGAQDILARLVVRAALADQNAAAGDNLPAKPLHSEPLSVRVASVYG